MRGALLTALLCLAAPGLALERSEARAPCDLHDPLRRPFFGDTHVHTALSFDANALGVRARPADAYRFARGEALGLRPYDAEGRGRRTARLARPLDFAVVTDHAELLGETRICSTAGLPGHDSLLCRVVRRWPLLGYYLVNSRMINESEPVRYRFCGEDGALCRDAGREPWQEIQDAAEAAYDRSSACTFTSFVGYEWSGNPDSAMIHRNVVFRNERVPPHPVSYVDDPRPEGLWRRLTQDCLEAGTGCDVLAIPHNPNLSYGRLFASEAGLDAAGARRRAALEPLLEITQHKGDSECRLGSGGPGAEDELCGFETLPFSLMARRNFPFLWEEPPAPSYAREILAQGLVLHGRIGANPFRLGLVGASDSHEGTPGAVDERDFLGHAAGGDTNRVEVPLWPDHREFNPGGLTVLWAEENSRDALFEAMRRREAYGTSGPRLVVRFFGGFELDADLCERSDFAARGYREGVPMGGRLPPAAGPQAPRFAVWALRDPGSPGRPGTPLQRIQIVKLWSQDGEARERVFHVAGDAGGHADVDPASCAPRGPGADALCAVWRDPDFDPAHPALYYARVVENPSCRWTTWVCRAHGVRCDGTAPVPAALAPCCDGSLPATIQERAWTSPIWYDGPLGDAAGLR